MPGFVLEINKQNIKDNEEEESQAMPGLERTLLKINKCKTIIESLEKCNNTQSICLYTNLQWFYYNCSKYDTKPPKNEASNEKDNNPYKNIPSL